ncbi:hypothetical protein RCIP0075_00023 [Klebsiella phage RCIP0075]
MIRWLTSLLRPKAEGGYTAALDTTRPLPLLGQPIQLDNTVTVRVADPLPGLIEDTLRKYRPVIHLERTYKLNTFSPTGTVPAWRALPCPGFVPASLEEYHLCPTKARPRDAYWARLDRLLERDGYAPDYRLAVMKHLDERRVRAAEKTRRSRAQVTAKLQAIAAELADGETTEQFEARMGAILTDHRQRLMDSQYRSRGQWPAR